MKKHLIRDSLEMLKKRKESKEKVKELILNPRVKNQELYYNIMYFEEIEYERKKAEDFL